MTNNEIMLAIVYSAILVANCINCFFLIKIIRNNKQSLKNSSKSKYYIRSLSLPELEQYVSAIFINYIKLSIEKDLHPDDNVSDKYALIYTNAYTSTVSHFASDLEFLNTNYSSNYLETLCSMLYLSMRRNGDLDKMIHNTRVIVE